MSGGEDVTVESTEDRPAPDPARLAALEEQLGKFEGQKRWADVVRTLAQKAELLTDPADRVATFERIALVHVERTNNVAEAIKAYEQVLEQEPDNPRAIEFLKSRYEQRRDWEKLLGILRREATNAEPHAQLELWLNMARLATDKVKKPEVCIDLWEKVLERDPGNADALTQLAGFYDRTKDYGKLAHVLREQAAQTGDVAARINLLVKLGGIAGDKLNDDALAVEAWKGVLALDGNDRRAQEALKKRYLAAQAWDELEDFYADSGKWDDLISVLGREAEAPTATPEVKVSLFFRLARLWAEKKEKTDRAAKYYERVLELDAANRNAALALVPIYGAANNAKALAGVYEVKLQGDTDAAERVETLRALGELYEQKLKDAGKAFERYRDVVPLAAEDLQSVADLERLAEGTQRWPEAVQTVTTTLGTELSPETQIALRLRLGSMLSEKLGQTEPAIERYKEVLELDAANEEGLAALDRLFRATGRAGDLLAILERKLELAQSPEERRGQLYAIGGLSEGSLEDPRRAVETYNTVLTEFGDEPEALRRLDGLYNKLEQWDSLAQILERELAVLEDENATLDVKYRLGQVLEKHLGRPDEALEHYRAILAQNHEHVDARAALETLLRNPELRGEAARILEPVYELRADWEALLRSLEILLSDEADVAQRVTLLRKIGDVAGSQLSDGARAFEAYGRAWKQEPASVEVRDALEALAESTNNWAGYNTLLREVADAGGDAALTRAVWMKVAEVEDKRLHQVDAAVAAYQRVLGQDASDQEALVALEELFARTERWAELLGVYRKRMELTEDLDVREQFLQAIAEVFDQKLNSAADAVRTYREMLEAAPSSARAIEALDRLYTRLEHWGELADLLQMRREQAGATDEEVALMLRLAQVREHKMGEAELAIELYRQILELDAGNEEALANLARLVEMPAHALAVAELLEPVYREANAWPQLVHVHEIQVRYSTDPARRVGLLHQIAELHETAMDDAPTAFATLARAHAEDPNHEGSVQNLERLARGLDNFPQLAAVYEERIAHAPDDATRVALHQRAAVVHEDALGNAPNAIAHYQAIQQLDPRNLDAVTSLERLYRASEQWELLAQVCLTKAALLEDAEEAKGYLFQASEIYESMLERPDDAVAVYRKVLELDPEELRAIDALIQIFMAQQKWAELLPVYDKKIELVGDPDEKKKLYFEVGSVYEGELKDIPHAIDAYNKVLELDPHDLVAIQKLDHLYQSHGNWQELLSVLEREAELAGDPEEIAGYRFRTAEIHEKQLGNVARAVELHKEILDAVPEHEPALTALEAILHGDKEPLAAAAVLEPVYSAAGAYERLAAVLEVQLQHTKEPSERVALLHRLAELYEQALDNAEKAFDAYARAVPADPLNEDSLGNFERLADSVNGWPRVVATYDAMLEQLTVDPDGLTELGLRTAQLYEVRIENLTKAIERYKSVHTADPLNAVAVRSLSRLYEAREQWPELVEIVRKEIELPDNGPDELIGRRFHLAELLEQAVNDVPGALLAYRDVLDQQPDHSPTIASLESMFNRGLEQTQVAAILRPIYESQAEWEKLAKLQEASLGLLTDPAERLAMMYGIAELYESSMSDAAGALGWYARALREAPLDERALGEAERLGGSTGGWTDLAGVYADIVEANPDPQVKRQLGKRLARIYEEELGDVENAEAAYNYVLSVEAFEPDALERLDVIYTSTGNAERLAQVLDRRVQATQDSVQKIEFSHRLAQILETELGQHQEAIARYRSIVDSLDPQHEDALRSLERLYTDTEQWAELYGTYQKQLEIAPGDVERAELHARMANLAAHQLGKPADAVKLWNEVLTLRGEDPEALDALAGLHEQAQRWGELNEILERRMVSTDDFEQKVVIGLRIAQVHELALHNREAAVEAYRRVLDIEPNSIEALRALAKLHREAGQTEELVATLHTQLQVGSAILEASELRALWTELGVLYQQAGQAYESIDAWRHVVEIEPTDEAAIEALLTLYAAQEQWNEVVEVLGLKAAAAPIDEARIPIYLQQAGVWEEKLGQPDGARESYEKILATDALHDHAFTALEKLHTEHERWEPLSELYLGRHDALDEGEVRERVDLLRRMARVFDEKLHDNDQAFDATMIAYEEDVADAETVTLLERLAGIGAKWNGLLATSNEWWKAATGDRWIHIGLNMAKWYGLELNRADWAKGIYQQVLKKEPDNLLALHSMARLSRKTAEWPQLVQLLERCVAVARTDADRKKLHVELGEVLETQLNKPDQAVEHYRTALNFDARDVGALTALERVYGQKGDWARLVDALRRKDEALSDPAEKIEVRLKLAETLEDRVGDGEGAIAAYRSALEITENSIEALRGLERLYARMERPAELMQVLEVQLRIATSEREKIKLLSRIGEMLEEEFVRLPEAAQRFEQVLEIDPSNDPALRALARLYRAKGQWNELLSTYERHIGATVERREKVPLYHAMGATYVDEVGNLDLASDALQNALDVDPNYQPALETLAKVYERQGDWHRAVETLERLSSLLSDANRTVEIRHRIARVAEEQLGDEERALDLYRSVLDVQPGYQPTLEALRKLYVRRADWHDATRFLEREIEATETPRAKAKLYVELGQIWNEKLEEQERAVESFEHGIAADPDSEDAAYPLAFYYSSKERWADAEPLAEMLVRKSSRREPADQVQLHLMMGRVAAKLSKLDRAVRAFTQAYTLDRSSVEVLRELSLAYFDKQDWENAFKNYQLLLVHHKDELDAEGRADLYYRLGVIKREQGDRRKASNFLDKALEEVPFHKPTLEALIETYRLGNEWEQVVGYKTQVLENHLFTPAARYTALVDIGDLWQEKLKNPQKAIQCYVDALDLNTGEQQPLLVKLMALYQETRQWAKLIETVQRYSEYVKDTVAKAKYAYTIASVFNSEIKNTEEAVNWYNAALDLNSKELKPFAKINEILTNKKDFKQLERAYRKMIHRVAGKGEAELEYTLWENLGLIYRDRLKLNDNAIAAFRKASELKPDALKVHKILAELLTVAEQFGEAANHWMMLIENDVSDSEALHALFDLYWNARDYDKAWCVASTMAFLLRDKARDDVRAFYEQYKPRRPLAPQQRLDEERWIKDLFHPNEDPFVGKIFASVLQAVRRAKQVQQPARFGLTDRERQDPATSSVALVRAIGQAGAALSLREMPLIYLRPQQAGGLGFVPSDPWASVSGSGLLQNMSVPELQFIAARHMSYYRPEHYLRVQGMLPTVSELTTIFLAAIKIVKSDFEVPAEIMPTAQMLAQQMSQDPVNLEGLRKVVKFFLDQGGQVNIKKWFASVELTACRAGFLLSGDLDVSRKMLALEPGMPGDVPPNEKLKDLVLFSLSDRYFRLREALGITFQTAAA